MAAPIPLDRQRILRPAVTNVGYSGTGEEAAQEGDAETEMAIEGGKSMRSLFKKTLGALVALGVATGRGKRPA